MRSTAFAVLLLSGCATEPEVVTRPPPSIDVPVAVSCLPAERPARPATFTDRELAQLDDYKLVLGMRRDTLQLRAYTAELEALLKACQ